MPKSIILSFSFLMMCVFSTCINLNKLYDKNINKSEEAHRKHFNLYQNSFYFSPGGFEEIRNQYIWSYTKDSIILTKIDIFGEESNHKKGNFEYWIKEPNCNFSIPRCTILEGNILKIKYQCGASTQWLANVFDLKCWEESDIEFLDKLILDMKKLGIIEEEIHNRDKYYGKN